jgi:hypothetical protein
LRRTKLFLASLAAMLIVGLMAAGTASANGFTVVFKETTNFNSVDKKAASVECEGLTTRVGGGAHIDGGRRAVRIQNSRPIDNGWRAVAGETKPNFEKDWSLTVRVVCQGFDESQLPSGAKVINR